MIVPISFQFSEDFTKARQVMSKYLPARWVSTYSRNPASLFDAAVGVRSTILVSRKSQALLAVTGLRRWYSEFRPHLFETTSYSRVEEIKDAESWPRLASKEIVEFYKALILKKMRLRQAYFLIYLRQNVDQIVIVQLGNLSCIANLFCHLMTKEKNVGVLHFQFRL